MSRMPLPILFSEEPENLTSTVVKTPKVYWLDIGILRQLTGVKKIVTGEIYEAFIVGELIPANLTGSIPTAFRLIWKVVLQYS